MDFSKKEDRVKYLEDKFDNLLDVIGKSYGKVLMKELISRLDFAIDDFNKEMSELFDKLKDREVERQVHILGENVKIVCLERLSEYSGGISGR